MGAHGGNHSRTDGDRLNMGFLRRKAAETGSALYRFFIWPCIRTYKELATGSTMKQNSYIIRTTLEGRNYIGKDAFLKNCRLGYASYVQSGCDLTDTDIGRYTSIGSGVKTVIGSHPTEKKTALHPAFSMKDNITGLTYVKEDRYEGAQGVRTEIGPDVWLGNDVRIMGGVKIGPGAVVGAGAIVTKDLPAYSINVGIPAKTIKYRFTEEQIKKLLDVKWWEKDEQWIKAHIDDFEDVEKFLNE